MFPLEDYRPQIEAALARGGGTHTFDAAATKRPHHGKRHDLEPKYGLTPRKRNTWV